MYQVLVILLAEIDFRPNTSNVIPVISVVKAGIRKEVVLLIQGELDPCGSPVRHHSYDDCPEIVIPTNTMPITIRPTPAITKYLRTYLCDIRSIFILMSMLSLSTYPFIFA